MKVCRGSKKKIVSERVEEIYSTVEGAIRHYCFCAMLLQQSPNSSRRQTQRKSSNSGGGGTGRETVSGERVNTEQGSWEGGEGDLVVRGGETD
uniref:Uncharacterized protein n=1 Tax=Chromera velia CCMP2878 TaxID=1169474 RepID=A0A0G4H996_9ALVE|eukprot:Cvel_25348.t1-p1 / transcript=Cvel_25348.t1 / gene=Cvel_25348 / organism=Chromera_velia_CCMP2878 / gene_product=hypothetical protein / transcript_product=hypothetical protein / location=Cvel_scaffold2859:15139-15414(+) / protein_length=92 / sequence_SO=supercontig / SO=protein_coding / is_pseudo=false